MLSINVKYKNLVTTLAMDPLTLTLTCILIDPNSSVYSVEWGIPIVKYLFSFYLHFFLFFLFLLLHDVAIIHKPLILTNCTPFLTNQISKIHFQDFLHKY